jgi:hypothetical protein
MAVAEPSEFRLTPARAGLKAVAVPQGRNIQAGTAILKRTRILLMPSKLFIVFLCTGIAASAACTTTTPNSNSNQNTNINVSVDVNNLPPGLTASPLPPSTNTTPGIPPANQVNAVPKGATPTPGIPDPKTLNKPMKPGATPTPGIPSPEELRRQMQQPVPNINAPRPEGSGDMMMKGRKRPVANATPE